MLGAGMDFPLFTALIPYGYFRENSIKSRSPAGVTCRHDRWALPVSSRSFLALRASWFSWVHVGSIGISQKTDR